MWLTRMCLAARNLHSRRRSAATVQDRAYACGCRFDLGNVVYAINGFQDPQSGRFIAWAWLQENGRHCEDEYSYSGCLTCPRELLIRYFCSAELLSWSWWWWCPCAGHAGFAYPMTRACMQKVAASMPYSPYQNIQYGPIYSKEALTVISMPSLLTCKLHGRLQNAHHHQHLWKQQCYWHC